MPEQPSFWRRTNLVVVAATLGMFLAVISCVLLGVAETRTVEAPCLHSSWVSALFTTALISFIAACLLSTASFLFGLVMVRPVILLSGVTVFILYVEADSSMRPRRHTSDMGAVSAILTLTTAEITYSSQTSKYGSIEDLVRLGLLDSGYEGTKSGYKFTVVLGESDYTIKGTSVTKYGCWDYFSSPDGVVRYSTDKSRAPEGQSGQPSGL
jgi:hypothetical protein